MAYKLNFFYLKAYDWEADNYDPVNGTDYDRSNPGGYDAVNVYGDEYKAFMDYTGDSEWSPFIRWVRFPEEGIRKLTLSIITPVMSRPMPLSICDSILNRILTHQS